MIIVKRTVDILNNKVDEVMAAAIAMQHEMLNEDDCLTYRFFADLENPTVISSYEEWDSFDALAKYDASLKAKRFLAILENWAEGPIQVSRYRATEIGETLPV